MAEPLDKLDKHILRSYSALRWFMGIAGLILPLVLVVGGKIQLWWLAEPLPAQNSLSAYYHAGSECFPSTGVYRDLFVGLLAGISVCLVIYSGFGKLEDRLLNIAGIALAGVAFFPTAWPEPQILSTCQQVDGFQPFVPNPLFGLPFSIHLVSAVVFFGAIMAVNVYTAMDTVKLIQNEDLKKSWWRVYSFAKWLMPISVGFVLLVRLLTGTAIIGDRLVLWIEWAGIWAFSIYWLLKSIEIRWNPVDLEMVNGTVTRNPASKGHELRRQGKEKVLK